jgi:RecB family exonuclease
VTARQDTWLELRRGSKSGPVVFSWILPAGKHLRVSGPRIWARFAAARNADVTVDGSRVPLMGTVERLFTAATR